MMSSMLLSATKVLGGAGRADVEQVHPFRGSAVDIGEHEHGRFESLEGAQGAPRCAVGVLVVAGKRIRHRTGGSAGGAARRGR